MRKLGMRLLLHRFHEGASDFSDEPKNVAFRQQLEAKGISLEPWLSDSFELLAKTHDGEPYRVSFTRDVVDYLMMGLHFDTCLSPGSCNFFSTIANAVDINKQVVYGKTDSGRVIGRCLFTLTDQGSILTYHRYAHEPADAFDAAVDQFAERLAQAMNTRWHPRARSRPWWLATGMMTAPWDGRRCWTCSRRTAWCAPCSARRTRSSAR